MNILTREDGNEIALIGEIEKGVFEGVDDVEVYKIVDENKNISYATIKGFLLYEVEALPSDFDFMAKDKYCYTIEKGFYKNPNYIEPEPPIEEKVSDLQDYTADLLYQVCLLQLGTSDGDVSINK